MTITLPPDLERIVQEKVASGHYNSAGEFISEAIHLIVSRDDFLEMRREALRRDIQIGVDQADHGEVTSITMDEIMAEVEEHLRENK